MGMGEPLDNLDALVPAIRAMTHPSGLAVPLRSVTVSTVGLAPQVHALLEALPRVRMAFSVHCADDATRSQLMPINRRVPLHELQRAMRHYLERTRRRLTVQYVLLRGVNDAPAHAGYLADFLRGVGPLPRFHVNLIAYNAQSRAAYEPPAPREQLAFKTAVMAHGLFCKIRTTRGADKMAACGQLGNVRLRRKLRLASADGEGADGDDAEPEGVGRRHGTLGGVDLSW